MSGSMATPMRCSPRRGRPDQEAVIREKLTMTGSNLPRKLGRTDLSSDRHGSVDVVSFRSSVRASPAARSGSANHPPAKQSTCHQAHRERLHAGPCRQAGTFRACRFLDRGRHGDGARHVVSGHRHIFCVSRRRPDAADLTAGGNAIRLRRSDRGTSRQGRSCHQPATSGSGTVRSEA